MSFLDAAHADLTAFDPHRNEVLGLGVSAAMPLAAAFAVAGICAGFGLSSIAPLYADPLAHWPAALMFFPQFVLWGAAHYLASRADAGGVASRWVLALIGWGLLTPFLPGVLDPFWMGWASVFTFALAGLTALHVGQVSRLGSMLILPSLVWAAAGAIPGYVFLTNGWSPGFAVAAGTVMARPKG